MTYEEFLARKSITSAPTGIASPPDVHTSLFPFQRDIAHWALRRGRAALFEECGLGKSRQAIEWARVVSEHTTGNVLILTPLAVAAQFVREGAAIGVPVTHCREASDVRPGINVTNYERFAKFDPNDFAGVVLDESSILKSKDGKTRTALIESWGDTPFRLACTATPAPNDHVELGNHAEFLGIMSQTEMLATFFVHDGGETQKWRLRGHAEREFWKWVCSWAVCLTKPSGLGYSDDGYALPELRMHEHIIESDNAMARDAGLLFAFQAKTLEEQRAARRGSLGARVAKAAELVNGDSDQWICWCDLNDESKALSAAIPEALEVTGSDSDDYKEDAIAAFTGIICECEFYRRHGSARAAKRRSSVEPTSDRQTFGDASAVALGAPPSTENPFSTQSSEPAKSDWRISAPGTQAMANESGSTNGRTETASTPRSASVTPTMSEPGSITSEPQHSGKLATQKKRSPKTSKPTGSHPSSTPSSLIDRVASAQSAGTRSPADDTSAAGSTSIIVTRPTGCGGYSAQAATSDSGSSTTTPSFSSEPRCTCGGRRIRVVISKASIFGWGVNLQNAHKAAFVGLSHSFEALHQALRRQWRFGQKSPVDAHIITSSAEGAVLASIQRKREAFESMVSGMAEHMADVTRAELQSASRTSLSYEPRTPMRIPEWLKESA